MSDTHDIVPDGVDKQELEDRMNATASGPRSRCPDCGRVLAIRSGGPYSKVDTSDARYYCKSCHAEVSKADAERAESRMEVLAE